MATFCLIHGNWHDGSCWAPLVERLRARGHEAVAPDLPFDDPTATYARRSQPALAVVAEVTGPIVIVGHSVGSAEAALVAAEREPALLVYLCPRFGSFAPPPDAPPVFRDGFPFPSKDAEGRMVWEPEAAIAAMYPRLPEEAGRRLAERLRPGAGPVGDYPLDQHPDVATALIYARDDEFFTPEWEAVRRARNARNRADRDSWRPLPDDRRSRRARRDTLPTRPYVTSVRLPDRRVGQRSGMSPDRHCVGS